MMFWIALVLLVEFHNGMALVKLSRLIDLLAMAPVVAFPGALIGFLVGTITSVLRGLCIPVGALLGALVGAAYAVATNPLDGWLSLSLPVSSMIGTFFGVLWGASCWVVILSIRAFAWDVKQRSH